MKIGLIADVHANLPALEAVLDDMPGVDEVVCCGDVVGYNPWPRECLERVRDICTLVVQGNHDRNVDRPARIGHNEMARAGLEVAQQELSKEQHHWLTSLPPKGEIAGGSYLLTHSHPDPEHLGRYVYPAKFSEMRPYLDDYTGIVLGHTHQQHEALVDDRLVINPGSVGQPRDGESTAAYAVLNTEDATVELRRVAYDIGRVIRRVKEVDLPMETGTRLIDGA